MKRHSLRKDIKKYEFLNVSLWLNFASVDCFTYSLFFFLFFFLLTILLFVPERYKKTQFKNYYQCAIAPSPRLLNALIVLNTTSSFPSSFLSDNSGCFFLFKTKMPDLSDFSQNGRSTSSTFQALRLISICYKGSDLKYKYLRQLSCAVITDEKARTFPYCFMMLTL